MVLPHKNCWTRLKASTTHGVGVFAIRDIPKGTYVFKGDKSKIRPVKQELIEFDQLPDQVKQMYTDFCVFEDELGDKIVWIPDSFNNLTPSWYLNHSQTEANMLIDEELDFYTSRDIKEGEELLINYNTYSDEKLDY